MKYEVKENRIVLKLTFNEADRISLMLWEFTQCGFRNYKGETQVANRTIGILESLKRVLIKNKKSPLFT